MTSRGNRARSSSRLRFIPESVIRSFSSDEDLALKGTPRHIYRNTTLGTLYLDPEDDSQSSLLMRCYEAGVPVLTEEAERFEPSPSLHLGNRVLTGREEIETYLSHAG